MSRRIRRVAGGLTCAAVGVVSLGMMIRNDLWRGLEGDLAASTMGVLFGMDASSPARSGIIVLTNPQPHGLLLTPECTSGFLIGVVGLLLAPLFLIPRLVNSRTVLALGVLWAVILGTNVVRLAWTALAVQAWGLEQGLRLGHDYIGTVLTTLGTSLSGLIALAVALPWRSRPVPNDGGTA